MTRLNLLLKKAITNNPKQKFLLLLLIFLVYIAWVFLYFTGISEVPFHPDESTYIYMSQDVDKIMSGEISNLFYDPNAADLISQQYRLLDAPITRYVIGKGRLLTASPRLQQDWDWSKSWSQNAAALPDSNLLFIARFSIAIFLPVSIVLFFFIVKQVFSFSVAIVASFLLMTNSLILLHTRRAMAEDGLIFFIFFSIFVLIRLPKKWIFLSAIPITLALNAKQSAVFIVLIGVGTIVYLHWNNIIQLIRQLVLFGFVFLGLFYLLNPIVWNDPILVTSKMISTRSALTQNQVATINSVKKEFILDSIPKKAIGLMGQLFIVAPATEDVANYSEDLHDATINYFQNPLNRGIGRNIPMAGFVILLIIVGMVNTLKNPSPHRLILFSTSVVLTVGIFFSFTIPFQRYYLPIIPFINVFTANGLIVIILKIKNHLVPKNKVMSI